MSNLPGILEHCQRGVQRLAEFDSHIQPPQEILHIHKHDWDYELNSKGEAVGHEWWWLTYRAVDGLIYELEFTYDGQHDTFPEGRVEMAYYDQL